MYFLRIFLTLSLLASLPVFADKPVNQTCIS